MSCSRSIATTESRQLRRQLHNYFNVLAMSVFYFLLYSGDLDISPLTAILYWDYLITIGMVHSLILNAADGYSLALLGSEIRYLWCRSKTQSTFWFFVNRYLAILGNIPVMTMAFISLDPRVRPYFNVEEWLY